MTHKFFVLLAALALLLQTATTTSPASNCLGNCIACSDGNPLLCRPFLNSTSGKEYSCLTYYTGSNCQQTAAAYFVSVFSFRICTIKVATFPTGRFPLLLRSKPANYCPLLHPTKQFRAMPPSQRLGLSVVH